MSRLRHNVIPIAILIFLGVGVYAFNLHNGLFWDDDDWILNNTFVHTISWANIKFWFTHNTLAGVGLKSNYYRPFLFFTFALNYIISGVKPFSYHLVSNLIHIANGILVFSILNLVFNSRERIRVAEGQRPEARFSYTAFLTALIFLIHPLQTEAVTYISGRGDPLYVFFSLITLWFFIKAETVMVGRLNYRLLSMGSLILALLSREVAIIFPLLLITFYMAFISKDRFLKSLKAGIVKSAPYFAIVLIYGILRLTVLNFLNTLNFYTVHNVYADHLYVRIFTFSKALLIYLKLLVVPIGLHMERSMDPQLSFWKWPVWFMFLFLLSLLGWLVFLYKKEKSETQKISSSAPNTKYQILNTNFRVWFFGTSWFFIALGPVSGITPINAILYEHWLYLPMIGFWFIAVFYFAKLLDYFKSKSLSFFFFLFSIFLIVYLLFLGYQSVQRNMLWGKPIDFYSDIIKYEPDSVRINNNLGNLYFDQGKIDLAREFYQKAVASEDVFPQPHFNLGSILQSKNDIFGAIQEYEKAIKIDPNFYFPYMNLVGIYARQGNIKKASQYVTKLDELKPNDPRILYNAALIYAAEGNFDLAVQKAQQGLAYAGKDSEVKKALEAFIGKFTLTPRKP